MCKKFAFFVLSILLCSVLTSCADKASTSEALSIPNTPVEMTAEQQKHMDDILIALSTGGIRYRFDSIDEIAPEHLHGYFAIRAGFLSDDELRLGYDEAYPLSGWVDKEQIQAVLEKDFGATELPYEIENVDNLVYTVQLGYLQRGSIDQKYTTDGKSIYALIDYAYYPDLRTGSYAAPPEMSAVIYQRVLYTFESIGDNTVHLKSGKVVANK